jgi:hypothetical protein
VSCCRWSSDDWRSDLYVYESQQGIEIHVASYRRPQAFFDAIPEPVPFDQYDDAVLARWFDRDRKVHDMLHQYEFESIGLPHDGESFTLEPAEAAEAVTYLAALGYHVPVGVAEALLDDERDR